MKSEYTTVTHRTSVPGHTAKPETAITSSLSECDEALSIVRDIAKDRVDTNRLSLGHTKAYTAIKLDNHNHRAVCRLYLHRVKPVIGILNNRKVETRYTIANVNDLYKFRKELMAIVNSYDK